MDDPEINPLAGVNAEVDVAAFEPGLFCVASAR
jgi:hypothetical protein